MLLMPNFNLSNQSSIYQVRQIFALFYDLIALTLGSNSVKDLRITKIAKEIKFERVFGKLESKQSFKRESDTKYLRL